MNMKRILALLLSLILCLTPLSALAEGEEPEDVIMVDIVADSADESQDVTVGNVAGGGVDVTTRGDAQVSVTAKNVSSDDNNGIDATAYENSTITLSVGSVTSFSDHAEAIDIVAYSSSTITLTAGDVASSNEYDSAVDVSAYYSSTVSVTTGSVKAAEDGVDIFAASKNQTEFVVNGSVEAGGSGLQAWSTDDPYDSSIHGHAIVTVTGSVAGESGDGVQAIAASGGVTEVSVIGDVTGGNRGLFASSGKDASVEVTVGGDVSGKSSGVYTNTCCGGAASVTVGQTDEDGTFTGSSVKGGTDGLYVEATDKSEARLTVGDVQAGENGIHVEAKSGSQAKITAGDIQAGTTGVEAAGRGDGLAEVTVQGGITAGGAGVCVQGGNEAYTEGYYTHDASAGDAAVSVAGDITAGTNGIEAETHLGGSAAVTVTGDVKADKTGVAVTMDGNENDRADILIDGTLTAGEQAVVVDENTTSENLSLTVWAVEQQGTGETLVSGSGAGEKAFTDATIQYIIRTLAAICCEGQNVGTLSAAKDAEGTILSTVAAAGNTYEVAHEGDKVYLNMAYDADKYEVEGAYADEAQTVAAEKDESGNFFTKVLKGGGVFLSVLLKQKHVHSFTNYVTTLEPTCTEAGSKTATCSCGQATDTQSIPALGHDLVHHDAKAPTCTEIGWDAYDTCKNCDYSTYVEKAALGHDLIHHDAKAPTCTEVGWAAYDTCSRCDYTTYEEIPALGHDLVHHEAKGPTCTEVGWAAYDTCSRCDYTTYEEKAAHGHTPGEPVKENEVAAQVGIAGSYDEVIYCTVCEAELDREEKTVDPLPEPEPEPTPVYMPDPFTAFCQSLAKRIRTAEQNETVKADASIWPGLQRVVFEALRDRPDVALTLTCRVNGTRTEMTIPAGFDLMTPLGTAAMLTFEQISKAIG